MGSIPITRSIVEQCSTAGWSVVISDKIFSKERKKSNKISALRRLIPFFYPYKAITIGAFLALIFTALVSLILPIIVRDLVDSFNQDVDAINGHFIIAIIIAGFLGLGAAVRHYLVHRLGERIIADIRCAIYNKMIGMSPAFFENILTGEILSRITTDTTLVLSVISSSLSFAMRNAIIFVGGLLILFWTSPKLTGLVLIIVPFILMPIFFLTKKVRIYSRMTQEKVAQTSGYASESLSAAQTVQAFTQEDFSRQLFANNSEEIFVTSCVRIQLRSLMVAVVIFLIFTGTIGVIWVGAYDVHAGRMSAGILIQFIIYAILVAGSVSVFAEFWGEIQRAAGATERLVELLDSKDIVQDSTRTINLPKTISGKICFKGVTFCYPSRAKVAVLQNFNLQITPGETVALVGPSGCGKSTVLQLLLRFYDYNIGKITFNDIELRYLSRNILRQQLAFVPQDVYIFAATVMQNIRLGRPDANEDEIIMAAQAAAAHDFISALPKGYKTTVGERGVMLSGGQKQRLAIARTILRDAPVLLLDEATSALDAASEHKIQQALDKLSRDRTTIVIAHRLSTVRKADRIVVMDAGRIVATGSHKELFRQNGLYTKLVNLQLNHA